MEKTVKKVKLQIEFDPIEDQELIAKLYGTKNKFGRTWLVKAVLRQYYGLPAFGLLTPNQIQQPALPQPYNQQTDAVISKAPKAQATNLKIEAETSLNLDNLPDDFDKEIR